MPRFRPLPSGVEQPVSCPVAAACRTAAPAAVGAAAEEAEQAAPAGAENALAHDLFALPSKSRPRPSIPNSRWLLNSWDKVRFGLGAPSEAAEVRITVRMSVDHSNTEATTPRFPLFQGILPFDRSRLMPDIVAGITLAALGIPEVMGYTKIIGTPVITGLYTLLLPVLVFAIFGSSRHLVVAADSATAAMVSAALASYVGGPQYVALTSLVALVAGGLLLLARVLRLGFLADFLSRTVLVGFLTGVGAQVAFAELPGVLGLENGGEGFWGHLFFTAKHLHDIDPASVSIALCVLGVIVGFDAFRSPLSRRPVGCGRNDSRPAPCSIGEITA